MRIIFNLIYFLVFISLALVVMFLGGIFGVSGTFYMMVEPGELNENLIKFISILVGVWLLVIILRGQNKKVLKRQKLEKLEQDAESE